MTKMAVRERKVANQNGEIVLRPSEIAAYSEPHKKAARVVRAIGTVFSEFMFSFLDTNLYEISI